jgi:serine/threonine protein kinase
VQGIFPFKEARKEGYFYNLLLTGQIETYFEKVNGTGLSADFKDMILKLFSYNGSDRYTVDQLKAHPWLNKPGFNPEQVRETLLAELHARQQAAKPAPFQQ